MKVHEMIAELQKMPQNHEVIVDLHSEYTAAEKVSLVVVYENRGYYSRPYSPESQLKAHGAVHIG